MRHLTPGRAVLLLTTLALAGLSSGVPAGAASRPNGVIQGRVINASTDLPQAGVEVTLSSTQRTRSAGENEVVTTDRRGRYRFAHLATGPEHVYAIDARFRGGLFAGRNLMIPEQSSPAPVIESTLRVWPTTSDETSIFVERNDLFLRPYGGGLGVIESVTVTNLSERAYIGRRGRSEGEDASLGFALPSGAECGPGECGIVDATLDVPVIVPQDYGFAATVAIPPGRTQITFSYRVGGSGGTYELSRVALYPTAETSIYAAEPLAIESDRMRPEGRRRVGEDLYRVWSTVEGLDAGDSLPALVVADAGTGWGLVAGVVAFVLLLTSAVVVSLVRRRRADVDEKAGVPESRAELVRALAEIDLRYEAGELSRARWSRRRAELKSKLAASSPEHSVPSAPR
jgi:hypothetical protein